MIWRVVSVDNLPLILDKGLRCGNSVPDAEKKLWKVVGNESLITKRETHIIDTKTQGRTNDFVPFYFTPFTPMMYNIHTGYHVKKVPNHEMIFLVGSLSDMKKANIDFIFTDRHACGNDVMVYNDLDDLKDFDKFEWERIQSRDFSGYTPTYQAEALIRGRCSIDQLLCIVCYDEETKKEVEKWLEIKELSMPVIAQKKWYFR